MILCVCMGVGLPGNSLSDNSNSTLMRGERLLWCTAGVLWPQRTRSGCLSLSPFVRSRFHSSLHSSFFFSLFFHLFWVLRSPRVMHSGLSLFVSSHYKILLSSHATSSTIFSICFSPHSSPYSGFPFLPLIICLFRHPPPLLRALCHQESSLSFLLLGIVGSPVHSRMPNESSDFYKLLSPTTVLCPLPHTCPCPSSLPPNTLLRALHSFTFSLFVLFTSREPSSWLHGSRVAQGHWMGKKTWFPFSLWENQEPLKSNCTFRFRYCRC